VDDPFTINTTLPGWEFPAPRQTPEKGTFAMRRYSSRRPSTPRRWAALVEFAFVATVTVLFFFVILEYARFGFLLQVGTRAAGAGGRMASAHTGDGTTTQNIIDEVAARMAGRDKELAGFSVQVLNVDPATGNQIPSSSWDKAAFANGNAIMV